MLTVGETAALTGSRKTGTGNSTEAGKIRVRVRVNRVRVRVNRVKVRAKRATRVRVEIQTAQWTRKGRRPSI